MALLRAASDARFEQPPEASVSLNWRKGFNRVFVLASIFWAGYAVVVPPRGVKEADEAHEHVMKWCVEESVKDIRTDGSRNHEGDDWFSPCIDQAEENRYEEALRGWLRIAGMDGIVVKPKDRNAWIVAMMAVRAVVPPAAAYGLFRLGWFVLAWVMRGFQQI